VPLFLSLSCTEIVPNVGNGAWCWGDARHVSESWMAVGVNFLEADLIAYEQLPKARVAALMAPVEMVHRPRIVVSGGAEQLLSQEAADVVKRLLSSPQDGKVGGKDVDHSHPRMDLYGSSRSFEALPVAN
jgi:hypothetical protein